jgi:hypothetical protein
MIRATRAALEDMGRVLKGDTPVHSDLRERVLAIVSITLVVDLVGSVLIWLFERHQSGTEIRTFGDAIFWVSSQLLTVSSSLHNPVGTGARVLDVLLEIYAISVVAALAGSFAAFFHGRSKHRRNAEAQRGGS